MSFPIVSYKGAGVIEFGMTREQVRKLLGGDFYSKKRTTMDDLPYDRFESLGIFVYYKLPGEVEAIEFISPASPVFDNQNLLALSYNDFKKFLIAKDPNLEIEIDSLTSYSLGIGAYTPDADEDPSWPVESVIVFEKGYYD